jgi:hypothetical protein
VALAVLQQSQDRVNQAQQVQTVGEGNDSLETGSLDMDTELVGVLCVEGCRTLVKDVAKRTSRSVEMRLWVNHPF